MHDQPVDARAAAIDVLRTLRAAGFEAYLAGGCVRDELLGLVPKDYDVATNAPPDRVVALFPRSRLVGASFGVVQARLRGATVEIATFRSDGPYTDRRRPDHIHFSTAELDAQRRDFTINALFLDPLAQPASDPTPSPAHDPSPASRAGRVIDFVGGLDDLRNRIVRAVGDPPQRLAEDHLRALRAVRFAARFGFAIEQHTAAAIATHARELEGVSKERVGEELLRMLEHPARAAAVRVIHELGLVPHTLGWQLPQPTTPSNPPGLRVAALPPKSHPMTALAAWLLEALGCTVPVDPSTPIIHDALASARSNLTLSNVHSQSLRAVLELGWHTHAHWQRAPVAQRKRWASHPPCLGDPAPPAPEPPGFAAALDLLACFDPGQADAVRDDVARLASDGIGLRPPPLLTGDHLVAQGWAPGPHFRTTLERVYDLQLEGTLSDHPAALQHAMRSPPPPPTRPSSN